MVVLLFCPFVGIMHYNIQKRHVNNFQIAHEVGYLYYTATFMSSFQ